MRADTSFRIAEVSERRRADSPESEPMPFDEGRGAAPVLLNAILVGQYGDAGARQS